MTEHRRLAAIMFTDMVDFSALAHRNEALALRVLDDHRRLIRSRLPEYGGREVRTMGDGLLLEFSSALNAAECAVSIQEVLRSHNQHIDEEERILLRIGIHLGDVVETASGVEGDGVNIAARIEPHATPGGICVSEDVARQIQNKIDLPVMKLGLGELKNISLPITLYRILLPWEKRQRIDNLYFPFRRRKVQVWAFITGLASVVLGGFLISRFLLPHPDAPAMHRLGVLRFQSVVPESTSAQFSLMTQALFAEQFIGIEGIGVVDPLSLNSLVDATHPREQSEVLKVISSAQLSLLIDGVISPDGQGGYTLQAKLLNPTSGAITSTQSASFTGEGDLPLAVSALSGRILDFLQLTVLSGDRERDLRPWLANRSQNIEAEKAFIQASQFIYRGEPGEEKYLRRAIALDSTFIPPRIWLISGMIRRGEIDLARQQYGILEKMEAHASPFDASMIGWADAYIRNDVPGQVRALQRALEYSPNNNILLYALARGRYMLDDYQAALESINDALTMRWAFSPAYYLAGLCQYRLGHFKEAKEVLSRALVFEPVFRDIYGMLSLIAMSEGDTVESLRHEFLYLRRSVELGHTAHAANASLGRLSNTYGSAVNAARLYRRAITLEGTIGAYHVGLGESLLAMGRIDDALLESRLGLRLDSTQGRAYFTIARAFDTQGDSLHAARYYQSFLRFDSTSGDALTAHQRLLMILPPPEH